MTTKIITIALMVAFYICYFVRMVSQRKKEYTQTSLEKENYESR